MVTRTVIIDTEEHAKEFDAIVQQLDYVKPIRILTPEQVALGIGMPYTNEELDLFLTENESDAIDYDLPQVITEIKSKLGT